MLRDDDKQWSRVEDELQRCEYCTLWNAEQHCRRNRMPKHKHNLLCGSTKKRPDLVVHSVSNADRNL